MDVFFSDFDGYSESSSSDDQDDDEFMYGGHASSLLSNLEETIGKIDDFLSFERRYVHGDVVRLAAAGGPMTRMGRVTNVEMVVDLESVRGGRKLRDVSSKTLRRVRSVSNGDYVVAGPWVGKAEKVTDSVTVLFDDGGKCEFTATALVPVCREPVDDSSSHYPGQRVRAVGPSNGWFLSGRNEGTVRAVEAGAVHVRWLACARFGSDPPPPVQATRDLTPLSWFTHSNWQLGDWCVLPPGSQETFVVVKTRSKVDVSWQDGSESAGVDPTSLSPVDSVDAHEFWPHQFVLEKGTSADDGGRRWGVVAAVDSAEKTVAVKWGGSSKTEETVSAYELIEHPDYSYSLGDLVFRLRNVDDDDGSRIGIAIGSEDGVVEVKWVAGFTSKVAPHEIFRVETPEGVSTTPFLNDGNLETGHEKSPGPNEQDLLDLEGDGRDCWKSLRGSTPFNIPRAAIGFLSSFLGRLLGSQAYTSWSPVPDRVPEHGPRSDSDRETEAESKETDDTDDVQLFPSAGGNPKDVGRFDVAADWSSHHFAASPIPNQVKRSWLKKVHQEWNILAKDLPETIHVRVYEERMDLLHAAVVGAPGTPYHDGLFFFDIFLPPEYPHEPPMVHYNSGGLRVNPNLYESGRVCLSLLNTWTGTGTETWNPAGSTVLQVLVSVQALVLNEKPYFNEAGYEEQAGSVEGELNSCSYNENAFLMSCKSMLYVLRRPPKHFEGLVHDHFRTSCRRIVAACRACLAAGSQPEKSTGFKILLSKLLPKLVEAFVAKGFDCGELTEGGK